MVVHKQGLSPSLIAKVMDYNPAKVFGLYGRKGAFELGFDGDIVIVDPEKTWKCEQEKLLTKGHVSGHKRPCSAMRNDTFCNMKGGKRR